MTDPLRLDDLDRMTARIFEDKNTGRSTTATFAHFVEVCGMLTIHDRRKKREGLDVADALCKALGWYFPLLAKLRVASVEELVFRKFPRVCPYCRKSPHKEGECKLVRGTDPTVDHGATALFFGKEWDKRPASLDEWQEMFQEIYPRSLEERGRSTIGLLEELGEMAEAIRVFESHPKYFLGEAADVFSYIMGIANEHALKLSGDGIKFRFQDEYLKRYPGLCPACGSRSCACPSIPEATIGRMAKEMPIDGASRPFISDVESFSKSGEEIGAQVLKRLGGYAGLAAQIPFDRGDANRALVSLCLQIAEAVQDARPDFSAKLMAEAYRMSAQASKAGTTTQKDKAAVVDLLAQARAAWKDLDEDLQERIAGSAKEFAAVLEKTRVLFVLCSPKDETAIRVQGEMRAIKEAIRQGPLSSQIFIEQLTAATAEDFRKELMRNTYDIVHFSGHATAEELLFEDLDGNGAPVPMNAVAEALGRQKSIRCVILNACETGRNLTKPMAKYTVAMDESLDDEAALKFSTGFYDALSHGRTIEDAFEEGQTAVKFANLDASYIKLIQ